MQYHPFHLTLRYNLYQVLVALHIFGEEYEVVATLVLLALLVED